MFKVGDRVKVLRHRNFYGHDTSGRGIRPGTIVTLSGTDSNLNGDGFVMFVTEDSGRSWLVRSDDIEPVTEGPIRTVTRREIVPGVYGRVRVDDHKNNCNPVYIKLLDRADADATGGPIGFTAEELRETAHLLNQLAEALGDAG